MADETEIKFRFTAKGQQVSAAILGGKDKIEFTKAAASIDVHINDTDADVANIIDLDNKKQIVDIHDVVAVKSNIVQIPIKFEKNKITEDYQMNTIGIYAKYKDQEFLYAFGALKYPLYMHHTDDSGAFKMYTYITVGTVANVVIKTDNTESVSRDDLNKILVDYPTKSDIAGKANLNDVYNKDEIDEMLLQAGKLKKISVNGGTPIEPDETGVAHVNIPQPDLSGFVKKVNNHIPDQSGNVDLTDQFAQKADLGSLYGMTTSGVKQSFSKVTVTPDTITDTGVYRLSACSITAQVDGKPLTPRQWGWLIVLNYNDAADTNGLYQFLVINEKISKRVISLQQQTYPDFKTIADSDDLKPLTESIASKAGAVNGVKPDGSGNVSVPTYAPNLLKGTSEQPQNIPPNTSTDVIHLTTFSNTKYTVAVDIDYGAFSTGAAGCKLQVNNGGTVIVSPIIKAGSKGRASVTFTTPTDCSWIAILLNSNSSYIGKYSNLKACQWQDNDTPPDMTWVPAIEDYRADYAALSEKVDVGDDIEAIGRKLADKANVSDVYSKSQADSKFGGAIKKIDGYSPDSSGNMNLGNTYATINSVNKKANTSDIYTQSQIDQKLYFKANTYDVYNRDEIDDKLNKKISGFSNPDYVFGSSSTIDVDGVASGVFALNGCSLKASKGGSYVFTNVDLATYNWGYLVVSNYNGFTGGYHVGACVEYLVLLGTYNDVVGVYIRSFSPNDSYYNNVFKKLTN